MWCFEVAHEGVSYKTACDRGVVGPKKRAVSDGASERASCCMDVMVRRR